MVYVCLLVDGVVELLKFFYYMMLCFGIFCCDVLVFFCECGIFLIGGMC